MPETDGVGDGGCIISLPLVSNFVKFLRNSPVADIPSYSCRHKFSLLLHLVVFTFLYYNSAHSFSLHLALHDNAVIAAKVAKHYCYRHVVYGKAFKTNVTFTCTAMGVLLGAVIIMWLFHLLLQSVNVNPNPGPASSSPSSPSTDSSFSSSSSLLDSMNLSRHLSFVQYNAQSIITKLDILYTELLDFDILAFFELGLTPLYRTMI